MCSSCLTNEVEKQKRKYKKKDFDNPHPNTFDLNQLANQEEDTTNNFLHYHKKKQLDFKNMLKKSKNLDKEVEEQDTIKVNYPLGKMEVRPPKISFENNQNSNIS